MAKAAKQQRFQPGDVVRLKTAPVTAAVKSISQNGNWLWLTAPLTDDTRRFGWPQEALELVSRPKHVKAKSKRDSKVIRILQQLGISRAALLRRRRKP